MERTHMRQEQSLTRWAIGHVKSKELQTHAHEVFDNSNILREAVHTKSPNDLGEAQLTRRAAVGYV